MNGQGHFKCTTVSENMENLQFEPHILNGDSAMSGGIISSNSLSGAMKEVIPRTMLAQTIRPDRYGEPHAAFALETVPVPALESDECLVKVMAAGVNHNGIWAARGHPIDVIELQKNRDERAEFHIAGSDASGIVVAVGKDGVDVAVGDEVVLHCGWWDGDAGVDEIMDKSAKIWGG